MAVAAVPFIIEEALAYAYIGGAYEGLAYTVGAAALGSQAATDILVAGATIAGAGVIGGAALTAGVVGGTAEMIKLGVAQWGSKTVRRLGGKKGRKSFNRNPTVIKLTKRFKAKRRG